MKRILIVDDQPYVRRILRLVLERQSYEVIPASNGKEALECMTKSLPDVIITDICMPQMDGRELCQIIQRDYSEKKFLILVMTSCTEREEREWVRKIPNIEFLEKPVSPMWLTSRLKEYFRVMSG